jgi:hypothetical protein
MEVRFPPQAAAALARASSRSIALARANHNQRHGPVDVGRVGGC